MKPVLKIWNECLNSSVLPISWALFVSSILDPVRDSLRRILYFAFAVYEYTKKMSISCNE
jgi:hypothetical protein